jgi:hypothetical protein
MHNLGRREERETGGKNYKDGGEESWFYLSLLGYIESSFSMMWHLYTNSFSEYL